MQAVIMAGGQGSRLRPLTCDIPKPLVPLCGRPVIEYILDLIEKYNFSKATLTLMYKGDKITRHFETKKYNNIDLEFSFEDKPLGTAGSVKNALKECKEDFLVISGDAMCDFDLSKAIKFHKEKNAVATLILKKVEDPRQYGLVNIKDNGRIENFIEKPSYSNCSTKTANTGIYILSPKVLELIEEEKNSDFAMNIFPKMLEKSMPIYGYVEEGYWCDIGTVESYINCQKDMLLNKIKCDIKANYDFGVYYKGKFPEGEFNIDPPVYIGENVIIGENAQINNGTVLGDNITIGDDTVLNQTIVLNSAYISDNVKCNNAVICNNSKILRSSEIYEESIIGRDSVINEHVTVSNSAKVWNGKVVPKYTSLNKNLKYGTTTSIYFEDDGICGETGSVISTLLCNKIGSAVASLGQSLSIAVSSNENKKALPFKMALISGLLSSKANVLDLNQSIKSQFEFCMKESGADFGIYINVDKKTQIKVLQKGALPLMRTFERKIEDFINKEESFKARQDDFGKIMDISSLNQVYMLNINKQIENTKNDIKLKFICNNDTISDFLNNCFKNAGYEIDQDDLKIYISQNGKKLSMYSKETGYIFHEKLLTLACLTCFIEGQDVSISYDSPKIINKIAEKYNKKAYRYFNFPYDNSDDYARKLSLDQPFLKDCIFMSIKIINFLNKNNYSLKQAINLIPHFSVLSRKINLTINPATIIQSLNQKQTSLGEGITLNHENGEVLIRPMKSGKGIIMFAESVKSEFASEICDFFEDIIKKSSDMA